MLLHRSCRSPIARHRVCHECSRNALHVRPAAASVEPDLIAWPLIRTLVGLRHHEPRFQSRADRLGDRLSQVAWRRIDADVQRRQAQGEPVCDAARARRQCDRGRRRAVRSHRRRSRRRPAVGHESVRRDPNRRQDLRPRRHRHEELLGDRPRVRPRVPAPRAEASRAFRAVLRRGGRMRRRPAADRRRRAPWHLAAGLHRRRADRHGACRRAQGQEELALPRARARGAFVAHAARRQRRADRLRDRHLPHEHGALVSRRRRVR